jgi:hypothetical protein
VLNFYGLEAYDEYNLGLSVTGERGCFDGPEKYRAPGYIEGIGGQIGLGYGSVEAVYDFATMQGALFTSFGGGATSIPSPSVLGDSMYFGFIEGLKHSDDRPKITIKENIEGLFQYVSLGVNDMNPAVSIVAGATRFWSMSDPGIRGTDYYFGASVSPSDTTFPIDLVPTYVTNSTLYQGILTNYLRQDGRVNAGLLYKDINTGTYSPWWFLGLGSPSRTWAMTQAMKYVRAYESLHEKQWLGESLYNQMHHP